MTGIAASILEVPDPAAAEQFYDGTFGLGDRLRVRPGDAATSGFTLSLVVSQPSTVDSLVGAAVHAGATTLKPAKKSSWGYGGVVQAPDGAIWKIATSATRNTGPASRKVEDFVLLLGVEDVKARAVRRPGRVCVGDDHQDWRGQWPGTLTLPPGAGDPALAVFLGRGKEASVNRPVRRCAQRTCRSGG